MLRWADKGREEEMGSAVVLSWWPQTFSTVMMAGRESDIVCCMQDVPIWLEALLDGERCVLTAPDYSQVADV